MLLSAISANYNSCLAKWHITEYIGGLDSSIRSGMEQVLLTLIRSPENIGMHS